MYVKFNDLLLTCCCLQKTVAPSSQEARTGVQSALALCQSVALSVNCWSLGPLTAQAQLHLLPVVEVLAAVEVESGVTALQAGVDSAASSHGLMVNQLVFEI